MKQTATYLLLRTGREGLSEAEISDLRKLNATHCPAVVQKEIDIAVDRFRRLRRDPKTLTFTYLVESLRYRKPTRPLGGKGRDKPADYSDLIV
jgi:hypothetical protein